jgi:peptidoglycan L-alanyl-D-glutamate endopeptidase CwlK
MSSRSIYDLLPHVADAAQLWLDDCAANKLDVLITCTYRSPEEQDELFKIGRTKPGRIVTNARGWESWHQYRRAIDFVPVRAGKPVWGTLGDDWALWEAIGQLAEARGFEWAARWREMREYAHIQITGGLTIAEARDQVFGKCG